MAGFENSLRAAAQAILKRDLTESERVEFLELAGAIGMSSVEDYLYMLMVFKRNEDRVNGAITKFDENMKARFDEIGVLEQKIHDTLESSISRVLGDGARDIGRDMGNHIAESAKDVLKGHEEFHYERGQFLMAGLIIAISTVTYWLGAQFGFNRIDNESYIAYILKIPAGAVICWCVSGFAFLWSLDHWRLVKRDWFYKIRFSLQILLLVVLLITILK
ncbi:MAG: hypothetical protein LBS53_00145 [Synergistaceae bacterium]|nr:hypothetical protein [Synergistaceae bacterium]